MGLVLYTVAKGIGEQPGKLKRTPREKEIRTTPRRSPEPRSSITRRTQTIPTLRLLSWPKYPRQRHPPRSPTRQPTSKAPFSAFIVAATQSDRTPTQANRPHTSGFHLGLNILPGAAILPTLTNPQIRHPLTTNHKHTKRTVSNGAAACPPSSPPISPYSQPS